MERGSSLISNLKRGSSDIQKVFRGTNLVWSKIVPLNYILVSNDTTTAGTVALQKWDKDGNLVASRTYTQVGASTNWRPEQILSETDDNSFYYSVGVNANNTGTIIKWNTDLTINSSSSTISSRPDILVVGSNIDKVITTTTGGYSLRSKNSLNTQSSIITASTTSGLQKQLYRISNFGSNPGKFCYITDEDGMRVLTTDGTSFTTIWTDNGVSYDASCFVYNPETNGAIIANSNGNGRYIPNIDSSASTTALNNFEPGIRFTGRFSNGDILFFDGGNIRRRTWNNLITDNTTNVYTVAVSAVRWLAVDHEDNFYVVLSTTTNNFRKYNSSGTLTWQKTLPATGRGGGLAHK